MWKQHPVITETIPTSTIKPQELFIPAVENLSSINLGKIDERHQTSDDPGAEEKKSRKKGKDIRVEIVTIQSEPKTKLKSFGVASERLITERIEISPLSTPEVHSPSASPKLARRAHDQMKDVRLWVKDHVHHLKIPSFSKRSGGGSGSLSGPSSAEPRLEAPIFGPVSSLPSTPSPHPYPDPMTLIPARSAPLPPPFSSKPKLILDPTTQNSANASLPPPPPPPPLSSKPKMI